MLDCAPQRWVLEFISYCSHYIAFFRCQSRACHPCASLKWIVVATCKQDFIFQGVRNGFRWKQLIEADVLQDGVAFLFYHSNAFHTTVTTLFLSQLCICTFISQKAEQLPTVSTDMPECGSKGRCMKQCGQIQSPKDRNNSWFLRTGRGVQCGGVMTRLWSFSSLWSLVQLCQ